MAFTFNGFGTKHYGRRKLADGSYVTTKWIVLLFVPVIPLSSFRVLGESPSQIGILPVASYGRSMRVQKLPIDWRQVGLTYAFVAGIVAAAVIAAVIRS